MSKLVAALAAIALSLGLALPARAQGYPDHVVRIVNPFPPGGSVDILARILAQKLSQHLNRDVIVENRAGAGGNTGSDWVAKSDPDGYTLLFTAPGPLAINASLYVKGLPYDAARDFAPVALFATIPTVLMVHPSVPAKTVQELIALARKEPGQLDFASAGIGSTNHLMGEMFKSMAKIDIVHVPYRGAAPAMADLIGGHVQMFFDLMPSSLPQIHSGQVRVLANCGTARPASLPDVPTMAEQGLPDYNAASWTGLVAPARTPEPVLAKLREETRKILQEPDTIARLHELGADPGTRFGADFDAFLKAERAKWAEVVRVSGATAE